jgi:hypothetical protein
MVNVLPLSADPWPARWHPLSHSSIALQRKSNHSAVLAHTTLFITRTEQEFIFATAALGFETILGTVPLFLISA